MPKDTRGDMKRRALVALEKMQKFSTLQRGQQELSSLIHSIFTEEDMFGFVSAVVQTGASSPLLGRKSSMRGICTLCEQKGGFVTPSVVRLAGYLIRRAKDQDADSALRDAIGDAFFALTKHVLVPHRHSSLAVLLRPLFGFVQKSLGTQREAAYASIARVLQGAAGTALVERECPKMIDHILLVEEKNAQPTSGFLALLLSVAQTVPANSFEAFSERTLAVAQRGLLSKKWQARQAALFLLKAAVPFFSPEQLEAATRAAEKKKWDRIPAVREAAAAALELMTEPPEAPSLLMTSPARMAADPKREDVAMRAPPVRPPDRPPSPPPLLADPRGPEKEAPKRETPPWKANRMPPKRSVPSPPVHAEAKEPAETPPRNLPLAPHLAMATRPGAVIQSHEEPQPQPQRKQPENDALTFSNDIRDELISMTTLLQASFSELNQRQDELVEHVRKISQDFEGRLVALERAVLARAPASPQPMHASPGRQSRKHLSPDLPSADSRPAPPTPQTAPVVNKRIRALLTNPDPNPRNADAALIRYLNSVEDAMNKLTEPVGVALVHRLGQVLKTGAFLEQCLPWVEQLLDLPFGHKAAHCLYSGLTACATPASPLFPRVRAALANLLKLHPGAEHAE